jgi:hypothetical protein
MASMLNKQINSVLTQVYKRAENLDESLLDETFLPIPQIDSLLSTSEHHVLSAWNRKDAYSKASRMAAKVWGWRCSLS